MAGDDGIIDGQYALWSSDLCDVVVVAGGGGGMGGEGMGVNGHNMLNIHFECWTSMKALNVFILQLLFPDLSAFAEPAAPPSCRLH